MPTIYVPNAILQDVERLKAYHEQRLAYNIILYCKEENETEETSSPHTPLLKEEKVKEEKLSLSAREALHPSSEKNNGGASTVGDNGRPSAAHATRCPSKPTHHAAAFPPTADEVQAYLNEIGETRFTGQAFCDHYDSEGWRTKSGHLLRDWKAKARTWRKIEKNLKPRPHDTTKTRPTHGHHPAAPAQSQPRHEQLERHLAQRYAGNAKLAWLARQIDALAQQVGVSLDTYPIDKIAYDAQFFITFDFYRDWNSRRWLQALAYVKQRATAQLDSDTVKGLVYEYRNGGK